jgi:SAM-dependent methyltransferase
MSGPTDASQRAYFQADHTFHRQWDHFVVQEFARQRWGLLEKLIPMDEIDTAFDAGAGAGFSTAHAPFQQVWGGDRSIFMLSQHPFSNSRLLALDVLALPFPNGAFDLVFAWELLHHCADPERVVTELTRVSRRFLVLFEPNRNNLAQAIFALYDREHRWVLRYSLGFMVRLVAKAGLCILTAGSGGWIFPNRTPGWLLGLLKLLPYQLPGFGISNYIICEKP